MDGGCSCRIWRMGGGGGGSRIRKWMGRGGGEGKGVIRDEWYVQSTRYLGCWVVYNKWCTVYLLPLMSSSLQ